MALRLPVDQYKTEYTVYFFCRIMNIIRVGQFFLGEWIFFATFYRNIGQIKRIFEFFFDPSFLAEIGFIYSFFFLIPP